MPGLATRATSRCARMIKKLLMFIHEQHLAHEGAGSSFTAKWLFAGSLASFAPPAPFPALLSPNLRDLVTTIDPAQPELPSYLLAS